MNIRATSSSSPLNSNICKLNCTRTRTVVHIPIYHRMRPLRLNVCSNGIHVCWTHATCTCSIGIRMCVCCVLHVACESRAHSILPSDRKTKIIARCEHTHRLYLACPLSLTLSISLALSLSRLLVSSYVRLDMISHELGALISSLQTSVV